MSINAKTLQRQYDKLTPRERVALILEAAKRGDASERAALQRSAPRLTYRVGNHHGTLEALQFVAHTHLIFQLDRALSVALLAHVAADEDVAWRAACIAAYVFCAQADAFRAFCAELGIAPELAFFGFDNARQSLEFSERIAREFAFTFEETRAEMSFPNGKQKDFGENVDVITPERALNELRAMFNDLVGLWQ